MTEGFNIYNEPAPKKRRGGIKSFTFTASGTNGTSHRKNQDRKHHQYLKNRQMRSELYARRGSMSPGEWHTSLAALSFGTV